MSAEALFDVTRKKKKRRPKKGLEDDGEAGRRTEYVRLLERIARKLGRLGEGTGRASNSDTKERRCQDRYRLPFPRIKVNVAGDAHVSVEDFYQVCRALYRPVVHVLEYIQNNCEHTVKCLLADDDSAMNVYGRGVSSSCILKILDTYIDICVRCSVCGLPDTWLEVRNGRTTAKTCHACSSVIAFDEMTSGSVGHAGLRTGAREAIL